jgi:hypothetical protein
VAGAAASTISPPHLAAAACLVGEYGTTTPSDDTTIPRETGTEAFPSRSVACTVTVTVSPLPTPSGTSIATCQGGLVSRAFSCPFTRKTTVATPVPAPSLTFADAVAG